MISTIPPARLTYIGISAIIRQQVFLSQRHISSSARRKSLSNQPYSSIYEPGGPTEGPLRDASNIGAPRITPILLKQHLDQYVVGQDRAKKALATAVYNHYQRIQELQRRDEEEEELQAREERRRHAQRHPVEDEFPGQAQTVVNNYTPNPLQDSMPLTIEKSNVLLLGPSGVGKTLMAKTLARVLEVPFSMSDCTPFTQAGYIGEDADVCVQRLLAAANYDVTRAERGIICLDEIDKIATAKVSHGKDVSGEGVQQALLKIIEGTTLQIQAKDRTTRPGQYPTNSPLSGGNLGQQNAGQKGEVYSVKTDNILFICAGAFNGLHKMILDRLSKGSIGFGAAVRSRPSSDETVLEGEAELFEKHLPYYDAGDKGRYNTLDLVEPQDLQKFGLIPELVGRIPLSCALSSLDVESLVKVLTEPRNSLVRQYEQLFHLSSVELRLTSAALRIIASTASKMGTGARGLRTVMERLLADAMFETPGSGIKHVLITQDVAEKKCGPLYFARGQQARFHAVIAAEEEAWEEKMRHEDAGESDIDSRARNNSRGGHAKTFEEYREKATAAGFV
ncbi:hypothetical protein AMS68_008008 [Peltaster fructicola]|uniref:Clp ATPase C-terminal domain-containing protein n=1 Tax=Peltaster fructicola TaxID=286661 RepID=A0A6H0Y6M5_9PEZI|nr:hypothetical protein AMS68_008008 [Peltaster fructicola]